MMDSLIEQIDAILPQTQCTRCGFDGCLPYAQAIAAEQAQINRCPPGGVETIDALAVLLKRDVLPPDPECGTQEPHRKAFVLEDHCIGCTKCIVACPLDAIIGAPKHMHTVIPDLCSGCELCLPVCPVDCLEMVIDPNYPVWSPEDSSAARIRHRERAARLERERIADQHRLERKAVAKLATLGNEPVDALTDRKRSVIEAVIRKARERLASAPATASQPEPAAASAQQLELDGDDLGDKQGDKLGDSR